MNQQTVENMVGFYFQHSNTVLLLISVLVVMSAAAITATKGEWISRALFICAAAILIFFFSMFLTGITSAFYLNLAVEFLAALLAALLLDDWISDQFYMFFLLVFILVGIAIIMLDFVSESLRDVLLNISTDLLGSFIIYVLVRGAARKRTVSEQKMNAKSQRELLEQQRQLDQIVLQDIDMHMQRAEHRRGQLETQLGAEHEIWKIGANYCDTIFEIKCMDERELKDKLKRIQKTVNVVYMERILQSEDSTLYYYVFGRIK